MTVPGSENKSSDVRMKGFASRTTVDAANAWIDSVLKPFSAMPTERVSLLEAADRVLARDVTSPICVPGFSRSMMDGFALQAEETHGATPYNALSFQIVGTCLPGTPFTGTVTRGQAVRIMTGAPMPDGTDAVLPVEFTETKDTTLLAMGEVSAGKHVGTIGEDIGKDTLVLSAGRRLRPQDIGVLSSIGCPSVTVVSRPRVRILITGNELLPAGSSPVGYRIADANGPMLHGLVSRDGGLPILPGIIPDGRDTLLAAIREPGDILLVSGGSSVGQEDHVPNLLAEYGKLAIHGIAMRPSSPAGMGVLDGKLVFLLPGNPVSCLCAYDFFAGRAIRAMAGRSPAWPYRRINVTLTRKLVSTVGRVDYARVQIRGTDAEPLAISGASILSSTSRADGFVVIPPDCEGYAAGRQIEVFLYDTA